MTVAAWTNLVLHHPAHGYYATRRPIGAGGDFTTAPEISQMFGEFVGVWAASVWQSMGRPADFALAEIGPGRGTLMADALRALRSAGVAPEVHLIETSPSLREEQGETLQAADPVWHDTFEAFERTTAAPFVFVANELLDALPTRQFVRREGRWHERMVALNEQGDPVFALGPPSPAHSQEASEGTVLEISPAREALVSAAAATLARRFGAALFIDYGSLEACDRRHAASSPSPPEGRPAFRDGRSRPHHPRRLRDPRSGRPPERLRGRDRMTQGSFLLVLGLLERAGRLGHARPEQQDAIRAAVERLAGPEQMGDLFKVMALWHPALERPPGFGGP